MNEFKVKINKDGEIAIHVESLLTDEVLKLCAKHAVFQREIAYGICEAILKDEVDWNDGDAPWYTIISYGQSYFEKARELLLLKADIAIQKGYDIIKKERETYDKLYHEYLEKSCEKDRTIIGLKGCIYEYKETINSQKETIERLLKKNLALETRINQMEES